MSKLIPIREYVESRYKHFRSSQAAYDWLQSKGCPVSILTTGDLEKKSGRILIAESQLPEFDSWLQTAVASETVVRRIPGGQTGAPDPGLLKRLDDAETLCLNTAEEMQELHALVKALHESVGFLNTNYIRLRDITKTSLPLPPELPKVAKFRVAIVGGDGVRINRFLEDAFPQIRFLAIDYDKVKHTPGTAGSNFPRADLALILTKFMSHQLSQGAYQFYGKDNCLEVTGAGSEAKAKLTEWLVGRGVK